MAELGITPLGRTVFVRLDAVQEKRVGEGKLIIAARDHAELTRVGEIIAIGEECKRPIKVGDRVIVAFHAGTVIDWLGDFVSGDDTIRLLDEHEVLAKIV